MYNLKFVNESKRTSEKINKSGFQSHEWGDVFYSGVRQPNMSLHRASEKIEG
jgi:hypothetical protein